MSFFSGFKQGFKDFNHIIVFVLNFVLLSTVYLIGIGFTSVTAKIIGKHFLNIKKESSKRTFWTDYNLSKEPTENYYRQF